MHNLIFFAGASLHWTHLGNWTIGQIFIVVTNGKVANNTYARL